MKPVHGEPKAVNVPKDAQTTPPIPCDLKVGDRIIYTNPAGIIFHGFTITGFSPEVESWGAFIYLDWSSWWYPAKPENIRKENHD